MLDTFYVQKHSQLK